MFNVKKIHFIGICGTLMGNAAVYFQKSGYEVRGSDRTFYPPISYLIKDSGMVVYEGFSPENLNWQPDLVIVGNAISRGNTELEFVLDQKMNYLSLPEALKYFFIDKKDSIVVTGTHGKTTTTTMLSEIFEQAERSPSYMIGGIPSGKDSGFAAGTGNEVILEGDEYDTAFFDKRSKFLHYKPKTVILNNIEYDHSDIYNNIEEIKLTFKRLVNIVPSSGHLVANYDDANVREVTAKNFSHLESFGQSSDCRWRITEIRHTATHTIFIIAGPDGFNEKFTVAPCGDYQVYNFTAAIIVSLLYGLNLQRLKYSVLNFCGVKRRLEKRGVINECPVIEDFAHHPTAIGNVITEVRRQYPGKKILAAFEPRSNTTRRRIFQKELAEVFALADLAIIGKIDRPEALADDDRLDTVKLVNDIEAAGKQAIYQPDVDIILKVIKATVDDEWVCLIMTNGAFDGLFQKLGFKAANSD